MTRTRPIAKSQLNFNQVLGMGNNYLFIPSAYTLHSSNQTKGEQPKSNHSDSDAWIRARVNSFWYNIHKYISLRTIRSSFFFFLEILNRKTWILLELIGGFHKIRYDALVLEHFIVWIHSNVCVCERFGNSREPQQNSETERFYFNV